MSRVRVQNYRCYAADCLDLAGTTNVEADRRRLIEMAAGWHELATALANYMDEHGDREPKPERFETAATHRISGRRN